MACWAQLEFSDAMSPTMMDFIFFHDHVMLVLVFIMTYVGYMMMSIFFNKFINVNLLEHQSLEVIWTVVPVFILLYIGAPSLYILYSMDYDFWLSQTENFLGVKVIGHQWYWSYAHTNSNLVNSSMENNMFDSYMISKENMDNSSIRLLDVDNRLQLPCEIMLKFYVTAADVLHSWTVPVLGLKMDACPGRLNQTISFISHPGVFYGQCSEICGANHSFMPICVEARFIDNFILNLQSTNS